MDEKAVKLAQIQMTKNIKDVSSVVQGMEFNLHQVNMGCLHMDNVYKVQ